MKKKIEKKINKIVGNLTLKIIFHEVANTKNDLKLFHKIIKKDLNLEEYGFVLCSMYKNYSLEDLDSLFNELVDIQLNAIIELLNYLKNKNSK